MLEELQPYNLYSVLVPHSVPNAEIRTGPSKAGAMLFSKLKILLS